MRHRLDIKDLKLKVTT